MNPPAPAPRLMPLTPPYTNDVEQQLARWMPPGAAIEPLALFRTLMLHEGLAARMRPLGGGILGSSATVPARLREVMIDRTCALTGAEYEWGVHAAAFGAAVELSEEQLRSTVLGGPSDTCWEPLESAVMQLADELHHTSSISEELWRRLRDALEPDQVIELVVTAGWYHVIAYLCNGIGVELEDWAMRFPSPAAEAAA
jgi:4-carboxymuconolactone decarboxylase